MDNKNQKKGNLNKKAIFAAISIAAILIVLIIGYFTLSKIKSDQFALDQDSSQEQFEGSPEVSADLQQECQQSVSKIISLTKYSDQEAEFKSHANNCREVYFALESASSFRKEGMYPDLAVDLAHQVMKTDMTKAQDILNFAKTLKPWDFYLGPVSCDSHHVIDSYLESLQLPNDKVCIRIADYKSKLLSELQNKNFNFLSKMISNDDAVWMGQPESDVGCPEKISSIIDMMKKLTEGSISVEEPKPQSDESPDFSITLKTKETEKVTLVFKTEKECLNLKSVLVPNLEISE